MSGDPSMLLYQYIREQNANGFKQLFKTLGKKQSDEALAGIKHVKTAPFSDEEMQFFSRMIDEINAEGGIGASRHKSRKSRRMTKKNRVTRKKNNNRK